MATKKKAEIERPCADCQHLHDGKCTECACEVNRVAEVTSSEVISAGGEPVGGNTEGENTEPALQTAEDSNTERSPAETATYDAGLRNTRQQANGLDGLSDNQRGSVAPTIPIQERIANLLEDYAIENRIPVGCELVIAGRCFAWNGEKMVEAEETVPEPPIELSDADKTKLREFVAEQAKAEELPDGSVMLPLRIDVDQIEILRAWAEGAGENWIAYAQRTLEMALNAVLNGGAVAG